MTNAAKKYEVLPQWVHACHTRKVKTADEEVETQINDSQRQTQVQYMDPERVRENQEEAHSRQKWDFQISPEQIKQFQSKTAQIKWQAKMKMR